MLKNLETLISNLSAFDFMKEQEAIIVANQDKLADLQAIQLFTGIDSKGEPIKLKDNAPWGFGYRPYTIIRKGQKGQVDDRVTWRDTGALYRSLTARITNGQFTIVSKGGSKGESEKYQEMIERSGEEVIGLTESSRIEFAEDVLLPEFKSVLAKKTGLKF